MKSQFRTLVAHFFGRFLEVDSLVLTAIGLVIGFGLSMAAGFAFRSVLSPLCWRVICLRDGQHASIH